NAEMLVHDFELAAELGTIAGRVLDVRGAPMEGMYVDASPADGDAGRADYAITGADGSFQLSATTGARYDLGARDSRNVRRAQQRGVVAGEEDLEIVLREAGRLRLGLVDATTGARAEIHNTNRNGLWVRPAGRERWEEVDARVDVDGVLELRRESGP